MGLSGPIISGWRPGEDFELPPAVQVPLASESGSGPAVQMAHQVSWKKAGLQVVCHSLGRSSVVCIF